MSKTKVIALMCELVELKIEYRNVLSQHCDDISINEIIEEVMSDMRNWCYEYDKVLSQVTIEEAIEAVGGAR